MKKIFLLLATLFLTFNVKALTEDEARTAIKDYAYWVYNNKASEISYVSPGDVKQEKIFLGYKTKNDTYAMDCNAFAGFIVYNALQLQANKNGGIDQPAKGDGYLTSSGRPALNGFDGWCTHSSLYSSKSYALKKGENIQSAVKRIDLESKLKPGDLVAVVGFGRDSFPIGDNGKDCKEDLNQAKCGKNNHIMVYVGDGKYIHNRSSGVSLNGLNEISYGNQVGSTFPDKRGNMGPHGAITVLTLVNYESFSSDILKGYRFPDGNGKLEIIPKSGSSSGGGDDDPVIPKPTKPKNEGHWEHVAEKLHFCEREDTAKIVRIAYLFLQIFRTAVPIVLIISIMLSLAKVVTNVQEFDKVKKTIVSKVVAAILIFLVPSFVSIIMKISSSDVSFKECIEMANHPKAVNVWVEGDSEDETESSGTDSTQEKEDDNSEEITMDKKGIYITISNKNAIAYYFSDKKENISANDSKWISSAKTKIDFVLLPGNHYIYVKTKSGKVLEKNVEIKTSDIIATNDVNDIVLLTSSLEDYLKIKDSSIEEFNDSIARSAYIAGGSTKEGPAAAALALTQILYIKYKVKIPYGATHGTHLTVGAPPSWGSPDVNSTEKEGKFYNQGIHCGGFVAWSYYQGNFNMNSGIGSSAQICRWGFGTLHKISESDRGHVGDTLTTAETCDTSRHVAIMNAMDDKGYYLTEANASVSQKDGKRTLLKNIGIVTTYDTFASSRWTKYLDMTPTIEKKKNNTPINTGF